MATSQTPNPHRRRIGDRAPSAPPDGDPTTPTTPPAETATPPRPPRPPRRRRTTGDRRTTIDARTQEAIQAAVDRLIADAPPLSDETRERLAALLSTTTYRPNTTTRRRPAA